jgi:hypothetical protein
MPSGPEQFPPISDKLRFPLLTSGTELPCTHLMACERLAFFSPKNPSEAGSAILNKGVEWHLYGDTLWSSLSTWIEINTSPGGYPGYSGVLVITYEIPEDEADLLAWVARNGPLHYLFPEERGESVVLQRIELLRRAEKENVPGPDNSRPSFVQAYCIYRGSPDVRLVARYTDLLNEEGIPIPRYRMADVQPYDIELCRFTLHALFRLNQARLAGMEFIEIPQLDVCEPVYLSSDVKTPSWSRFHPSRVLRTRPAIRAIPTPTNLVEEMMHLETLQQITEARRLERNLHLLAFDLEARPRIAIDNDQNACTGAFMHRANGGAIYVLPDRLVEEFDNTDCDEIRIKDIKLPFPNLFLKFTPPQPLFLAEGAPVDGCYLVKQGDEYLLSLTSFWSGVDYSRSLSVTCLDPTFSIHLPAPELKLNQPGEDTELSVNEAVELGIKEFLEKNAPPTDNISQTITRPDGTTAYVEDIRAQSRKRRIEVFRSQEPVFRACLNIIVNAACFISFRPEDITEEWDGNPPAWIDDALKDTRETRSARDRKQHALRVISSGDYTRIRICGKNLFTEAADDDSTSGKGTSPRAHWRRGHWRRQRHGIGLSLMTPRWIRPTIVKKDNGPLVESRIYDIQTPPNSTE